MSAATEQAAHGGGGHHDEEEHEEHVNHEAWAIPYADMVTLLMALFLMLFALSTIDLKKFEALADSLNGELGGGSRGSDIIEPLDGDAGGPDPIDIEGSGAEEAPGTEADLAEQALEQKQQLDEARLAEDRSLERVKSDLQQRADRFGLGSTLEFQRTARGLIVTVVSDKVLFEPGSADLQPIGRQVLGVVADVVRELPNDLMVEGHTDNRPINTAQFPSNWELSTERATKVLRELVERNGIPAERVSAAGYGEHHPVGSNASAAGRAHNRRVELVILSQVPVVPH